LIKEPEGTRLLARYTCRQNSIKMDLKIGCKFVGWIRVAEDVSPRVQQNAGDFMNSLANGSYLERPLMKVCYL
jgi:hypothetical protein